MKWTPDLLKEHYDERLDRLQDELQHRMDGFPQEYATTVESDQIRKTVEDIRADHVQRREYDDLKNNINQSRGGRVAVLAASSIIVAILMLSFGILERGIPTTAEIVTLIKTQAPWVADEPAINTRIAAVEREDAKVNIEVQRLKDQLRTVCIINHLKGC